MISLQEKQNDIAELLQQSTAPHLADCIDLVPQQHIISIYEMIRHYQATKIYKTVTRERVALDVAAILEGNTYRAIHSNPFLLPVQNTGNGAQYANGG